MADDTKEEEIVVRPQKLKKSKATHKSCHALTVFFYRNIHVGLARVEGTETFATCESLEYIGDVGRGEGVRDSVQVQGAEINGPTDRSVLFHAVYLWPLVIRKTFVHQRGHHPAVPRLRGEVREDDLQWKICVSFSHPPPPLIQ